MIAELQTRINNATDTAQLTWLENHLDVHLAHLNRLIDEEVAALLYGRGVYANGEPIEVEFYQT